MADSQLKGDAHTLTHIHTASTDTHTHITQSVKTHYTQLSSVSKAHTHTQLSQ